MKFGKMKNTKNTKIIFWGTPDLTITYLNKIEQADYEIIAVVTLPDRPVGRKQIITAPLPKIWANERNIPVLQPEKLDSEFAQKIKLLSPDISVVVAYGKIIPEEIISIPKHGTFNIHYSLLPRWRGSTPVESAILHNDSTTGVSIQKMIFKLDAGDVINEKEVQLQGNEYREDLRQNLSEIGSELLIQTIPDIVENSTTPKKQGESQVTYAKILKKEDGLITLQEDPQVLWQKWRALYPWPGLFFFDEDGKRIKITQARFENQKFIIEKVIPEGKKEIDWK